MKKKNNVVGYEAIAKKSGYVVILFTGKINVVDTAIKKQTENTAYQRMFQNVSQMRPGCKQSMQIN